VRLLLASFTLPLLASPLQRAEPPARVVVETSAVVHARFQGPGFHVFFPLHPYTQEQFEQVLAKRWVELDPAFARVTHRWSSPYPDQAAEQVRVKLASWLRFISEQTHTVVYLTTWDPPEVPPGEARQHYARRVAAELEWLMRQGAAGLKYYCMTNELSYGRWGALIQDLATFADFHRRIDQELKRRRLRIGLLATDASPVQNWNTLVWASQHMDHYTAIYGGHHYVNEFELDDPRFYDWFFQWCRWAVTIARQRGKEFLIGEFGARQDGRIRNGKRWDACIYWDTPQEPWVGIQLAEATLAAMNAGVWAMAYWTFTDFPDSYSDKYANKWGVFRWADDGWRPRAVYYAYGLLTKFLRGPGTVYKVSTTDPLLRAAAMQRRADGAYTLVIVNRRSQDTSARLELRGSPLSARFRKYIYDPNHVPRTEDGDLQEAVGVVEMHRGVLEDRLPASSLVVYTTAFDDASPQPPANVTVRAAGEGAWEVSWDPSPSPDVAFYRIYRNGARIGSTIGRQFRDYAGSLSQPVYRVQAVDRSGNASR